MGVYIKGMELPNEGVEWICFVRFTNRMAEFYDPTGELESIFYEVVKVPAHGRLVDADDTIVLLRSLGSRDYRREKGTIQDAIKMLSSDLYTPTVIPEEEP